MSLSRTALLTTFYRASETKFQDEFKICNDELAEKFLLPPFSSFIKSKLVTKIMISYIEKKAPGAMGYVFCRTKYFDDFIIDKIQKGLQQFVILGAGFDSRAYRINNLNSELDIFELDNYSIQKIKIKTVEKVFGNMPINVKYIPINFLNENFEHKLNANGFNCSHKSLFFAEGLFMYLHNEQVNEILSSIKKNSKNQCSIIFDYLSKSNEQLNNPQFKSFKKQQNKLGENFSFEIKDDEIYNLLSNFGFKNITIVKADELKLKYLHRKRKLNVFDYFSIVNADL